MELQKYSNDNSAPYEEQAIIANSKVEAILTVNDRYLQRLKQK